MDVLCGYPSINVGLDLTFRALHLKEEVKCHLCDFTAVWRPLLKAHKIKVHCSNPNNGGEPTQQPKKRGRPRKQQNYASSGNQIVTGS